MGRRAMGFADILGRRRRLLAIRAPSSASPIRPAWRARPRAVGIELGWRAPCAACAAMSLSEPAKLWRSTDAGSPPLRGDRNLNNNANHDPNDGLNAVSVELCGNGMSVAGAAGSERVTSQADLGKAKRRTTARSPINNSGARPKRTNHSKKRPHRDNANNVETRVANRRGAREHPRRRPSDISGVMSRIRQAFVDALDALKTSRHAEVPHEHKCDTPSQDELSLTTRQPPSGQVQIAHRELSSAYLFVSRRAQARS